MYSAEKAGQSNLTSLEASFSVFTDLDPTEYYGLVTDEINFNHLNDLHRLLEGVDLPDGVLIATCGSDGKLEQHAQSQTELVVVQKHANLNGDAVLRSFFGKDRYRELFDVGDNDAIDMKSLDTEDTFSYAYDNPDIVYPDRVLNSYPVYPLTADALDLYYQARIRTLDEMSSSRPIRKEMKGQLRDYKHAMQTGVYRRARAFDTDRHVQYYSEIPEQYTLGFKTSFIRAVQRKLDLLTISLKDKKTREEVAKTMPTTTVGRLAYVAEAGIVPFDVAAPASEAYAWFLQQYHFVQENYKGNGVPTEMPYDPKAFAKYSQDIERLVTL